MLETRSSKPRRLFGVGNFAGWLSSNHRSLSWVLLISVGAAAMACCTTSKVESGPTRTNATTERTTADSTVANAVSVTLLDGGIPDGVRECPAVPQDVLQQSAVNVDLPVVQEGFVSVISMRIIRCDWDLNGVALHFDGMFEPTPSPPITSAAREWAPSRTGVSVKLPPGWHFRMNASGLDRYQFAQVLAGVEAHLRTLAAKSH
jgi:hypothetical protein